MLVLLYFLLIIVIANHFFFIGSWWFIHGVFNVADIGNGIILITIFFALLFCKKRKILLNPISALLAFYFLLVLVHSYLAITNYNQSLLDTVIAIRHQSYFLSFFLFLLFLESTEKMVRLLDWICLIAIFVTILAVVNYFGPTIFSHKWAEGHGIRIGVKRAFIPAMDLVSLGAIWAFTKWQNSPTSKRISFQTLFLTAAHFLRQTRMRLVGLIFVMVSNLILKRQWKKSLFLLFAVSVVVGVANITSDTNPITEHFTSAYENVIQQSGTWKDRYRRIGDDINEFKKHPFMGDGLSAVRWYSTNWTNIKLKHITKRADLGYTTWLKYYGIVGMVWLALFFGFQFYMVFQLVQICVGKEKILAVFCLSQLTYVITTLITLNHLMVPERILLVCLNAAIIYNLYRRLNTTDIRRLPFSDAQIQ